MGKDFMSDSITVLNTVLNGDTGRGIKWIKKNHETIFQYKKYECFLQIAFNEREIRIVVRSNSINLQNSYSYVLVTVDEFNVMRINTYRSRLTLFMSVITLQAFLFQYCPEHRGVMIPKMTDEEMNILFGAKSNIQKHWYLFYEAAFVYPYSIADNDSLKLLKRFSTKTFQDNLTFLTKRR